MWVTLFIVWHQPRVKKLFSGLSYNLFLVDLLCLALNFWCLKLPNDMHLNIKQAFFLLDLLIWLQSLQRSWLLQIFVFIIVSWTYFCLGKLFYLHTNMFGMYDMFWSFVDFYMCVCVLIFVGGYRRVSFSRWRMINWIMKSKFPMNLVIVLWMNVCAWMKCLHWKRCACLTMSEKSREWALNK